MLCAALALPVAPLFAYAPTLGLITLGAFLMSSSCRARGASSPPTSPSCRPTFALLVVIVPVREPFATDRFEREPTPAGQRLRT